MPAKVSQEVLEILEVEGANSVRASIDALEILVVQAPYFPPTVIGAGISQDALEVLCVAPGSVRISQDILEVLTDPGEAPLGSAGSGVSSYIYVA